MVNAAFAPLMAAEARQPAGLRRARTVPPTLPRAARDRRPAGARSLRRLWKNHQLEYRRVAARRGRGLRGLAGARKADGPSPSAIRRSSACRSGRATSVSCSAASTSGAMAAPATSPATMCARSKHGIWRTCWCAAARSIEREEVEAIRNALAAIERPDDELSVYATLRGPLFALTDGALLQFRETARQSPSVPSAGRHDWRPSSAEVRDALWVLRDLHRGRNRRPIADTIAAPAGRNPGSRRNRHLADRRAGAGQRDALDGHGAALRGGERCNLAARLRR